VREDTDSTRQYLNHISSQVYSTHTCNSGDSMMIKLRPLQINWPKIYAGGGGKWWSNTRVVVKSYVQAVFSCILLVLMEIIYEGRH
jgi:hypothetical protein